MYDAPKFANEVTFFEIGPNIVLEYYFIDPKPANDANHHEKTFIASVMLPKDYAGSVFAVLSSKLNTPPPGTSGSRLGQNP